MPRERTELTDHELQQLAESAASGPVEPGMAPPADAIVAVRALAAVVRADAEFRAAISGGDPKTVQALANAFVVAALERLV